MTHSSVFNVQKIHDIVLKFSGRGFGSTGSASSRRSRRLVGKCCCTRLFISGGNLYGLSFCIRFCRVMVIVLGH